MKLDWHKVYFGKVNAKEVLEVVKDEDWQQFRRWMKGCHLSLKYDILMKYLVYTKYSREAKIRVTNYVTSLSRAGLIKPSDYRDVPDNGI